MRKHKKRKKQKQQQQRFEKYYISNIICPYSTRWQFCGMNVVRASWICLGFGILSLLTRFIAPILSLLLNRTISENDCSQLFRLTIFCVYFHKIGLYTFFGIRIKATFLSRYQIRFRYLYWILVISIGMIGITILSLEESNHFRVHSLKWKNMRYCQFINIPVMYIFLYGIQDLILSVLAIYVFIIPLHTAVKNEMRSKQYIVGGGGGGGGGGGKKGEKGETFIAVRRSLLYFNARLFFWSLVTVASTVFCILLVLFFKAVIPMLFEATSSLFDEIKWIAPFPFDRFVNCLAVVMQFPKTRFKINQGGTFVVSFCCLCCCSNAQLKIDRFSDHSDTNTHTDMIDTNTTIEQQQQPQLQLQQPQLQLQQIPDFLDKHKNPDSNSGKKINAIEKISHLLNTNAKLSSDPTYKISVADDTAVSTPDSIDITKRQCSFERNLNNITHLISFDDDVDNKHVVVDQDLENTIHHRTISSRGGSEISHMMSDSDGDGGGDGDGDAIDNHHNGTLHLKTKTKQHQFMVQLQIVHSNTKTDTNAVPNAFITMKNGQHGMLISPFTGIADSDHIFENQFENIHVSLNQTLNHAPTSDVDFDIDIDHDHSESKNKSLDETNHTSFEAANNMVIVHKPVQKTKTKNKKKTKTKKKKKKKKNLQISSFEN